MNEFSGMDALSAKEYVDELSKQYAMSDQKFKIEYNALGKRESEIMMKLKDINSALSEINKHVSVEKNPDIRALWNEQTDELIQQSKNLNKERDKIIAEKKELNNKSDIDADIFKTRIAAYDHYVTGTTPDFNVNTKTLIFSNKERLPGYGTTSHDTPEGTMAHVYVTERNTEPSTLYVTQRQSDASQTKTISNRSVTEKFANEKFIRIINRAKKDFSKHLDMNTEGTVEAASDWDHVLDALKQNRPYEDYKIELENVENFLGRSIFQEEGLAKTSSATPTASYTEMIKAVPDAKAFQKTNQDRMIQETVNWAAQNGYTEVRFPTAETATNVQSYESYLRDPMITSWKEVDGKIMMGVPSDPDAYLNLVNNIPTVQQMPYDGSMTLANYLDVTKNKATIPTKNLSQEDRLTLATMLNKQTTSINKTQVPIIPPHEQPGIVRAISASDKPLWEYVQKTDSEGKPIKGKEFKSDFYTEDQVIRFKEVLNGGKRRLNHFKQSKKDNITPYEHPDRYMLLPDDKYNLMQEYEDIGKLLKKRYPNAQIDKIKAVTRGDF